MSPPCDFAGALTFVDAIVAVGYAKNHSEEENTRRRRGGGELVRGGGDGSDERERVSRRGCGALGRGRSQESR